MTGRLLLGLMIICVATGKAGSRKADCFDYKLWDCTYILRPVCGSNGVTYANECVLCRDMGKIKNYLSVAKEGHC